MASGWQVQSISLMSFSFAVRNDKFHNSAQKLKQKTKKLTPLHHFDFFWICITNIRNDKSFTIWSEIKKKIPPPHRFESFWICITEIRMDSCLKIVNNNKENCYQSWDIVEKQVETSSFNNHENVKERKKERNNNE